MAEIPTKLLTRAEAARELRISLRTIDNLISRGDIPVVKIGSAVRIRYSRIETLIEARESRKRNHRRL